jgi:predicted RecB family nuclease
MVITQQIFEAFLKCPTKSQLSRDGSVIVENSAAWPQELEQIFIRNGWSRLCASIPADQVIIGASAAEAIRQRRSGLVVDCTLQTSDLGARLHGLEIIGAPANAQTRYVPIRFLSNEKVSATDKLLLAFDAFVLSQVSGCRPDRGKLIHGREYTTTIVSLASLYGRIKAVIKAITALQTNSSPQPVVLNRHCSECQYASRCRQVAEKADDLSLLAKMTEKTRQKYHQKGIFTVTQLSYTYRPRRRRGGVKHDHALKALAIRKNQVHVIGKVAFSQVGTPIYIDVEGDPDRDFYYCIGLRFEAGGVTALVLGRYAAG